MVSSGSTNYTTERIKPMIQKHLATEKTQLLHCPQDVPRRAGSGWAPSCKEKGKKELVYKGSHFSFIQGTKLGGQRGEKRKASKFLNYSLAALQSEKKNWICTLHRNTLCRHSSLVPQVHAGSVHRVAVWTVFQTRLLKSGLDLC